MYFPALKRYIRVFFFLTLLIAACNEQDSTNNNAPASADTTPNDTAKGQQPQPAQQKALPFILDSLLKFDSEAALKAAFGDSVKSSRGYLPEGEGTYPNTLLFPETGNEVVFVWDDTILLSKLSFIRIRGARSDWQTAEGIKLGTTLKELEKLNGKPFSFYGFGWDYSGFVNWQEGTLQKRKIGAQLMLPGETVPKEFEALLGDQEMKSSDALAQKANPVVDGISMYQ